MCPGVGLLYRDCKEVQREPGATKMMPVKTKARKDMKLEQPSVRITAGKPKGSRPIHAC
jgi:hypothetical protein